MAIPKKGSRKITVEGENYRWLIRRKATHNQTDYGIIGLIHVAIEHANVKGKTLWIVTDKEHPQAYGNTEIEFVTPADIAKWISEAIALNWNPKQQGPQISMRIENGKLVRY